MSIHITHEHTGTQIYGVRRGRVTSFTVVQVGQQWANLMRSDSAHANQYDRRSGKLKGCHSTQYDWYDSIDAATSALNKEQMRDDIVRFATSYNKMKKLTTQQIAEIHGIIFD